VRRGIFKLSFPPQLLTARQGIIRKLQIAIGCPGDIYREIVFYWFWLSGTYTAGALAVRGAAYAGRKQCTRPGSHWTVICYCRQYADAMPRGSQPAKSGGNCFSCRQRRICFGCLGLLTLRYTETSGQRWRTAEANCRDGRAITGHYAKGCGEMRHNADECGILYPTWH
jgi:hypothetical protein